MLDVLLIDDDLKMADLLSQYLSKYDIELSHCPHPHDGIEAVKSNHSLKLVILDLMMPDMDGFEVCKTIRTFSQIPIIMLTARGEVTDRIVGLEIGADDYISKPFEPRELVARINNILKRTDNHSASSNTNELNHGQLHINFISEQVFIAEQAIKLTSKEYALLKLLANQPNTPMSRDDIINQLSGIDAELFSRSVDILVSRLRSKLKPLDCIKTVWNRGYSYVPDSNNDQ